MDRSGATIGFTSVEKKNRPSAETAEGAGPVETGEGEGVRSGPSARLAYTNEEGKMLFDWVEIGIAVLIYSVPVTALLGGFAITLARIISRQRREELAIREYYASYRLAGTSPRTSTGPAVQETS